MEQCTHCGHTLGVGRYCVNCGQPHGASSASPRDDALAPPTEIAAPTQAPWGPTVPPPAAPPPVYETPPQARYPMYADEPRPAVSPAATPAWGAGPAGGSAGGSAGGRDGRRRRVLPWLLAALVLVLVAGVGVFLLVGGDSPEDRAEERASDPGPAVDDPGTSPSTPVSPTTQPPSTDPVSPSTPPIDGEPVDVGRLARAIPPSTADPSVDVDGNAVRYDGFYMLDGQDDTAWRTDGDASGTSIGFELATPVHLTSVGLINGYTKSDPGYDGYSANRRILSVEWIFEDGTVVPQTLDDDQRGIQTIDVDVVTSSVELAIVAVSKPGPGDTGRNFTAISTVELLGVPQR